MPSRPRFGRYEASGAAEFMMSFGSGDGPQLLIVPPLLEELNRTRKLLSDLMRLLAERGIASHLPDLPGTGESTRPLEAVAWRDWRDAVAAAAVACRATALFSLRGGTLLDDAAQVARMMRFSPVEGKRLLRDLVRSRSVTDSEFDAEAQQRVFERTTWLGGYPLTAGLAAALRAAAPADTGAVTLRLEGDAAPADAHVAGTPLWRRAEPSGSPELAASLANEIVALIA